MDAKTRLNGPNPVKLLRISVASNTSIQFQTRIDEYEAIQQIPGIPF